MTRKRKNMVSIIFRHFMITSLINKNFQKRVENRPFFPPLFSFFFSVHAFAFLFNATTKQPPLACPSNRSIAMNENQIAHFTCPLVRPSVASMAIVRTVFSPRCWATSRTYRTGREQSAIDEDKKSKGKKERGGVESII